MSTTVDQDTRASEPSTALDRPSPQDGDVVVRCEADGRLYYTVRQLPGIVQFSAGVRDEAVRVAREFAQRYAVDVWYGEGGTYRLLEAYRPRTSRSR
jgi:hypothetical protein